MQHADENLNKYIVSIHSIFAQNECIPTLYKVIVSDAVFQVLHRLLMGMS